MAQLFIWLKKLSFISFIILSWGCTLNYSITNLSSIESNTNLSPSPIIDDTAPKVTPICDASISSNFGGGDGSTTKPFAICSLSQWDYFASNSSSWSLNIKLYANLDFTGYSLTNFISIGNTTTSFTGSFDGNGFKIANLTLVENTGTLALFKKTDSNVKISNLTLENIAFSSKARLAGLVLDHGAGGSLSLDNIIINNLSLSPLTGGINNCGGLVGQSNGDLFISNVTINTISLNSPGTGPSSYWGALVGKANTNFHSEKVSATSIILSGPGFSYSAGIAGSIQGNASFDNYNIAGLNVNSSMGNGAGLISLSASDVTIFNVHLSGSVQGTTEASGLINMANNMGTAANINISESSFDGTIAGSSISGGLIGVSFSNHISITKSYYKGNMVSVWWGTGAGLIAQAQGASVTLSIADSYVISSLFNSHATKWLVSGLIGTAQGQVTLDRSYFSGTLGGAAPKACIADNSSSASFTATDSYFDATLCTANANKTGAITGVTGISTSTLQASMSFPNWQNTVWTFTGSSYPKLKWEP